MRNVLIGTAAAFVGGGLVVALQTIVSLAGARYPPIVQGLHCNFIKPNASAQSVAAPEAQIGEDADELAQSEGDQANEGGRLIPAVTAGDEIDCYLDAPGADYAAWAVAGRTLQFRSGPLDLALECQDAQAFAAQSPDNLKLSGCQSFRLTEPGEYRLVMKVLARGTAAVDREQLHFLVRPKPPAQLPAAEPPVATRLRATLELPGHQAQQARLVPVSESLNEHGLLPTSRDFSWVVYRLASGETYVGSKFQANSASNASNTRVSYAAKTRSVTMSFTLRSGPFVDRWRGWISGNVVVQVKRQDAVQNIELPDIDLHVPGQSKVALPDNVAADRLPGAKLRLVRSGSGTSIETPIGSAVTLDDAVISTQVVDGNLVIDAKKK